MPRDTATMDLDRVDVDKDWQDNIKPGDVVFGKGDEPVSRGITFADGYWSHCGLYIGGGEVAQSVSTGLETCAIDEFIRHYPSGVAYATTNFGEEHQLAAAEWAERVSRTSTPYSGSDMGSIVILNKRQFERQRSKKEPEITEEQLAELVARALEKAEEERMNGADTDESYGHPRRVCSGFVFRSYAIGSASIFRPGLAEGRAVEAGQLAYVLGEGEIEDLMRSGVEPDPNLIAATFLSDDGKTKYLVIKETIWVALTNKRKLFELEEAITPGDIWMSPNLATRWFMNEASRQAAQA